MSCGPRKEGGPAILQVHRKDGRACLLLPCTQCFLRNSRSGGGECKGGGEKSSEGIWWPHVTDAARAGILQAFVLNVDAGAENKPLSKYKC